jgi:tripartite-type tricarboxylate transporter receptor subunit TctC
VPTLKEAGYDVALTPQIRAVVAPPEQPAELRRTGKTPSTSCARPSRGRSTSHDNQLEESFADGATLKKTMVDIEKQLKDAIRRRASRPSAK